MRGLGSVAPALAGLLMFCWASLAAAQTPTGEGRSGWYVEPGHTLLSELSLLRRGSAVGTVRRPLGLRSCGRCRSDVRVCDRVHVQARARLELSFGQRMNGIKQMFRSVSDFAGNRLVRRRGNPVTSDAEYWIDNLTVRTLAFNAHYDFRATNRRFSPFVGVGPAFTEVRRLHYAEQYRDIADNEAAYDPPLSFYASRQNADLSDTVLAGHLHAGTDLRVADRTALGVKLTYLLPAGATVAGRDSHPLRNGAFHGAP